MSLVAVDKTQIHRDIYVYAEKKVGKKNDLVWYVCMKNRIENKLK